MHRMMASMLLRLWYWGIRLPGDLDKMATITDQSFFTTVTDFIPGFIFPHECAYERGHSGDMNFVVAENVAGDNGGVTKYGIDKESHPNVDVANLTQNDAFSIYLNEFHAVRWSDDPVTPALSCFPGNSAFAFFDAMEVCGLHEAWLFAQRALPVDADGVAGPETRSHIMSAPANLFTLGMINQRKAYHQLLAQIHANDKQFLEGWLNRCDDLIQYLS